MGRPITEDTPQPVETPTVEAPEIDLPEDDFQQAEGSMTETDTLLEANVTLPERDYDENDLLMGKSFAETNRQGVAVDGVACVTEMLIMISAALDLDKTIVGNVTANDGTKYKLTFEKVA